MIVIAVVQKSREFLIVRRKENKSGLIWHFPGGSKEPGDGTEKHAAERETLEETGIICMAKKNIGSRVHPKTNAELSYWLCDYVSGEEKVRDEEELDMVKWASGKDIIRLFGSDLFPPVKRYFQDHHNLL